MNKIYGYRYLILVTASALVLFNCSGKKKTNDGYKKPINNQSEKSISLASGQYEFAKNSSEVLWECMWLGGAKHNGSVQLIKGALDISKGGQISGSFVVSLDSIKCFDIKNEGTNQKLVSHLKSDDFFDVENYPKATLQLLKAEPIGGNNFKFEGDLMIKGKTHSIVFNGQVIDHQTYYEASLDLIFDRSKYDVRYRSASLFSDLGDRIIADDVKLGINVNLNRLEK
jgi:polyisoprenoid-binding protein YceI